MDSGSSVAAIRGVLGLRGFRRLWYCTALSSLGDWLGLLAMTALATSLTTGYTAQNYALGGVLIVQLLPAMVLGPLAGVFADRFDRRRTMVNTDFLRFVLFLTIPLAHLFVDNRQTLAWMYIASFFIQCLSLFWTPAKDASVPNLVRRDQVEAANQLSLITTYGLTPVAAAGLFSMLSLVTRVLARHFSFFEAQPVNLALYFNAATFLVGALVVYTIREITGQREQRAVDGGQPSLKDLSLEGVRFIRSSPLVGGLIIGLVGAFAAGGAVIGAGKIFVHSLGGGNAAYGVLFGTVFVGLGSGMALGPRIGRSLSRRRLFGLSIVFAAVCLILAAVMPQVALAMIFTLGVGFGAGVAYLAGTTLMGTDVDDELRGRIFAVLQTLIRVVLLLAVAAVPFTVAAVGKRRIDISWLNLHSTVDGTRFVLAAGGLLALLAGVVSYRKMDDRQQEGMWADLKLSLRGDAESRRRLRRGTIFVAFEGGEGSGKSTQIRRLAESMRAHGHAVVVTHEPGATPAGRRIRDLLLHDDEELGSRSEALLFAADRAHHVENVVRPHLDAGESVLTDRYVDSSLAYQAAGRDLPVDEVRRISRWATQELEPDLTVLLDVPAREGLLRASRRAEHDKLEQESIEFHNRVRHQFRMLAESRPRRYLVLNGLLPEDELAAQIFARVQSLLPDPADAEALRAASATDGLAVVETAGTVQSVTLGGTGSRTPGPTTPERDPQNDAAR